MTEIRAPKVGEVLVYRFRKRKGQVQATVISVNHNPLSVKLEIGGEEFSSLSAAAKAINGTTQNGWVYWGLKKQKASPKVRQ